MKNSGKRYTEDFKAYIIRLVRGEKRSITSIKILKLGKDFKEKDTLFVYDYATDKPDSYETVLLSLK